MAHDERDNANALQDQRTNGSGGNTPIGRGDRPLFTARNAERKYFKGTSKNEGEDGNSSPIRRPRSGPGSWLSGKTGRGINLGEAFERTDEDGALKPMPAQVGVWKEKAWRDSRIPRSKTFSPDMMPSPPRSLTDAYIMAQAEERSTSAPVGNERALQDARDVSPSPAARSRRWSRESDERRLQRLRYSEGVNLRGKNRESPLGQHITTTDAVEEDVTVGSSGSSISGLSLVEDPTQDNFDEKMKQFSRDQERLNGALQTQRGLFSRMDVGSKVAETTRNLVRKSSASSLESEPSVRPPRTWGSKAKKSTQWMNRILLPGSSVEVKDLPPAPVGGQASIDWQSTAADVPLPSVEDGSLTEEPTPPSSRPSSAKPSKMSPEKSKMWEAELDFTAQSLQMSTSPQLRVRNMKLDEIRNREIETLSQRALATNRLEEIRERNSEERSASPEIIRKLSKDSLSKTLISKQGPDKEEPIHDKTVLEEEGEPIRGTPITIFSSLSLNAGNNKNARENTERNRDEVSGPVSKRDESLEILRRLSRASTSPSPVLKEEKVEENLTSAEQRRPGGKSTEDLKRLSNGLELQMKHLSATSTPPKSDVDPEERITAEAMLFELQDNKSEKNSIRGLSPSPSDDRHNDETARPKPDPLSLPTPKVTGAYIDTPVPAKRPARRRRPISPSGDVLDIVDNETTQLGVKGAIQDQGNAVPTRPRPLKDKIASQSDALDTKLLPKPRALINTAKPSTASEDLRRIKQESQIEDSTLDDFDVILEREAIAPADLNNTDLLEPVLELEYDENGRELSEKEKVRRLETLALDRMSKSLKRTSINIRDAKRGIEGLEDQVSSSQNNPTQVKGQNIHNHKPCPACANHSSTYHLTIPLPRLWISTPPNNRRRFTWFGLFLTIFLAWYISESVMCEYFCHPIYSHKNNWHPSDPFFPYAIPTKLDQWSGKVVSGTAGRVWEVWTGRKWNGRRRRGDNRSPWGSYGGTGGKGKQSQKQKVKVSVPQQDGYSPNTRWIWEDEEDEKSMFEDETI